MPTPEAVATWPGSTWTAIGKEDRKLNTISKPKIKAAAIVNKVVRVFI